VQECWITLREALLELFLVKVNDQIFNGDAFSTLTIALQHHLLVVKEDLTRQQSRHLIFYWFARGKNFQKEL